VLSTRGYSGKIVYILARDAMKHSTSLCFKMDDWSQPVGSAGG